MDDVRVLDLCAKCFSPFYTTSDTLCRTCRREHSSTLRKEKRLQYKHHITEEEYRAMLERQNGGCAICRGLEGHRRLAVDHDHRTGKIRGLLCGKCNTALGLLQDSPYLVSKAHQYLSYIVAP